jgi:hypothetical protein
METGLRTCDATIGEDPGDFGFVPRVCRQSRYVRTFVTTGGIRVGYCPIPGHESSVRRRFAEQQDPPEPEWDLPDGPDYADSMTYSKWFAERVR